jgi:hypothetical protein
MKKLEPVKLAAPVRTNRAALNRRVPSRDTRESDDFASILYNNSCCYWYRIREQSGVKSSMVMVMFRWCSHERGNKRGNATKREKTFVQTVAQWGIKKGIVVCA